MAVGVQVTKAQVNEWVGNVSLNIATAFTGVRQVSIWLARLAETDEGRVSALVALGYTTDEAQLILEAFADLTRAANIGQGLDTQDTPYDFTRKPGKLWGFGVRSTT